MRTEQSSRAARVLKVRHEPPTIEEAIGVARDLTDTLEQQVGIVAGLVNISAEEARERLHAASAAPERRMGSRIARPNASGLIVERRTSRLAQARTTRRPAAQ